MLATHPLVQATLEGLQSNEVFDPAVDAAVELIYCSAARGQPDQRMLPLVNVLVPAVSVRYTMICLSLPRGKPAFANCSKFGAVQLLK